MNTVFTRKTKQYLKIFGILLIAAIFLMNGTFTRFRVEGAAVVNFNIEESQSLRGVARLSASSSQTSNLSFTVDSNPVSKLTSDPEFVMHYVTTANTDNVMRAANEIYINNNYKSAFKSDGLSGMFVREDFLQNGVNTVTIIIGGIYGISGVYNPDLPHGVEYQGTTTNNNKDDFTIKNFYFSLPGGVKLSPTHITHLKPKAVGQVGYKEYKEVYDPDKEYWLGDGYLGSNTYDGHPNPRFNIPFSVKLTFNYSKPASIAEADIDTAKLSDGSHQIAVLSDGAPYRTVNVFVDNTLPSIGINVREGQTLSRGYQVKAEFSDGTGSGIKSTGFYLNETEVALPYIVNLENGRYNFVLCAEDNAGNVSYLFREFSVGDETRAGYDSAKLEGGVFTAKTLNESDSVVMYEAVKHPVTAGYGINRDYTNQTYGAFQPYGDYFNYSINNNTERVATSSSLGNPYQIFETDIGAATGIVKVSFDGGTKTGERFVIRAYNKTQSKWVDVARGEGEKKLSFEVNAADFAESGKIKFILTMEYLDENKNRMLWLSDTQYLTKFDDLHDFYYQATDYIATEYKEGRLAYMIHTGDIVEDNVAPGTEASEATVLGQYAVATRAFETLDQNNVPYGVVSGNHETGSNITTLDYNFYTEYFGESRYNNNPWYGGSLNNNKHHYDLVTVGGYDLVVLYIGYGVEALPETIEWANKVLKMYSHRNAILATHVYLSANGSLDQYSRAKIIYDKIIQPNENVKFLLCGHTDGAVTQKVSVTSERTFYAFLACYQFWEGDKYETDHLVGTTYGCNGEAYMRELIIEGNTLKQNTFSPVVKEQKSPYGGKNNINNTFETQISFTSPQRTVFTNSFSVVTLGEEVTAQKMGDNAFTASYSGNKAILAMITENSTGFSVYTFAASSAAAAPQKPGSNPTYDYVIFKELRDTLLALKKKEYSSKSYGELAAVLTESASINEYSDIADISAFYARLLSARDALEPGKGKNPLLIGLLAGGIPLLILGGAAGAFFYMRKRKSKSEQKTVPDGNESK